jgi:uncharacterized Zn-finger protein
MNQFFCLKCDKTFLFKKSLNRHNSTVHKTERLKCLWPECQFETKYKKNLIQHKERLHTKVGQKRFGCEICGQKFNTNGIRVQHIRAFHLGIRYKCDFNECKFETNQRFRLKRHKLIHSGIKKCLCEWPGCESRFATNSNLRKHVKVVHMNERQFKCHWPECNEDFLRSESLETHINKVHKNSMPFQCQKCDKSYGSERHLTKHLKFVHENSVKYDCSYSDCSYSSKSLRALKIHQMRHSGEKPFRCQWNGCESAFVTNFELKEHHKCIHSNERPFLCEWPACEATFKFKQNLLLHYNSHKGLKQKKRPKTKS